MGREWGSAGRLRQHIDFGGRGDSGGCCFPKWNIINPILCGLSSPANKVGLIIVGVRCPNRSPISPTLFGLVSSAN